MPRCKVMEEPTSKKIASESVALVVLVKIVQSAHEAVADRSKT